MSDDTKKFKKVWDISKQLDLIKGESISGWTAGTDVTNLATDIVHLTGKYSLTFDKSATTVAVGTISKTLDNKNGNLFALHNMKAIINLSSLTDVASVSVVIGKDASHNNVYTVADSLLATGWNQLDFDCDDPTTVNGNGIDWYNISYIAVTVTLDGASDTLTNILIDSISLFKLEESGGTVSENVNLAKVGGSTTPVSATNGLLVNLGVNNDVDVTGEVTAVGDVAHDAVDSGKPIKIGGIAHSSSQTAVSDADRVNADFTLDGKQKMAGFNETSNANRNNNVDPLNLQYLGDTLIDETNIPETTTAYAYIDMTGYRGLGIQGETSGATPTDVLTVTLEATIQDDGTAMASCDYQDVTNALTGSASFVDTDFIALIDTPLPVKYLRVKYTTSTDGGDDADLTVYIKKLY